MLSLVGLALGLLVDQDVRIVKQELSTALLRSARREEPAAGVTETAASETAAPAADAGPNWWQWTAAAAFVVLSSLAAAYVMYGPKKGEPLLEQDAEDVVATPPAETRWGTRLLLWASLLSGGTVAAASVIHVGFMRVDSWLNMAYLLPTGMYIITLIGFYDRSLVLARAEKRRAQAELDQAYDAAVKEAGQILDQQKERNALSAEQGFESMQNAFVRFLRRCAPLKGSESQERRMLEQLRRFVQYWLRIFNETSVDGAPRVELEASQLHGCASVAALCQLVEPAVAAVDGKIIFSRKERDGDKLKQVKAKGFKALPFNAEKTLTWIKCGRFEAPPPREDGFPMALSCGCCTLLLLSREHRWLVLCVLFAPVLMACNIFGHLESDGSIQLASVLILAALGLYIVCLVVLLLGIERIDGVLQLAYEVEQLERSKDAVEAQRTETQQFWRGVQDQVDVWLHGTMPRLELCKEVHQIVEGLFPDMQESSSLLDSTCQRLERIEDEIGDVSRWKDGRTLQGRRTQVGEAIRELCRQAPPRSTPTSVRQLLQSMDKCLASKLPQVLEEDEGACSP